MEKNSAVEKIRHALGLYRHPPYIGEHLALSNIRSLRHITFIASCIEVWMLVRFFAFYVFTGRVSGAADIIKSSYGYWILLVSSLLLYIYSVRYLKGRLDKLKNFSRIFTFLYFALGICFGFITTLRDICDGRMMICFLTMLLLVSMVFIWRPFISIILTAVCSTGFILLIDALAVTEDGSRYRFEEGDLINFATYIITLLIVEISIYYQRYQDASKSYSLECSSITDDLTGIPNMRRFEREARDFTAASLKSGRKPVYLLFDISNFQTYNDHFGYSGGDRFLKVMGALIAREFDGEPYARVSGDTFAAVTDRPDIQKRAENIRDGIKAAAESESYLGLKAGAYPVKKADTEPRRALDRAGLALKQIKGDDSLLINIYSENMSRDHKLRKYILNNIDSAVKNGCITAYYQPVISAEDETLISCEALARWIDPEMGFLSPGQFVPILEASRQIHKLDRCIFENVCRNIRECLDSGKPVVSMSLNFSRLDFDLMDAVGELESLVEKYRIPKGFIHVEITESSLSDDVEKMRTAVSRFHECGYEVWLDDFGSGYSSMNVLKDFSFDLLKIDMEFLRNFSEKPASRKLIKGIINIAGSLGMKTLSEGVETREAVDFLKEAGCGRLQGYYYSKPVPYDKLLEMIADGTLKLSPQYSENITQQD